MRISYPDFITNVGVEKTSLTRRFPDITFTDNPEENQVTMRFQPSTFGVPPIRGEGAIVNLVFDVSPTTPLQTSGEVRVLNAFVATSTSGPNGARVDLSDVGSIMVSPRYRPGDIDGSADVSIQDVSACALLAFGAVPHRGFLGGVRVGASDVTGGGVSVAAGDITGDGTVDIGDLNRILFLLAMKNRKLEDSVDLGNGSKGTDSFKISLNETPFENLPGSAEMEVGMSMPPAESEGISGAAFTVAYATDHVDLKGVDLDGDDFDFLFYDQRDYSRGWKEGRVKVIVSSDSDKVINGKVAKVKFDSNGTPPVPTSDVPFVAGKMAKSSGEDIAWNDVVDLEQGKLIFGSSPELDINVVVDDIIDPKDLLIFIDRIKNGVEQGEVLNEFAKEWYSPRPTPTP